MRKLKLILTAISAALMMMAFQNCGSKVNFSSNLDEVMSKDLGDGGELVLIEDELENPIPTEENKEEEIVEEEIVEENVIPEEIVEENVIPEEIVEENVIPEEIVEEEVVEEEGGEEYSNESGNYICILEGPGKSVRLGFDSEQLVAVGQTPQVVCSTKRACEDLISQAFDVKAVAKRGFCGKNPHTHSLSETQIAALLGL